MMVETFAALADPNRLRIVDLLLGGPTPVTELVTKLKLNQPHVSKQLKVLKAAGVVDMKPDGQRRLYALRPQALREVDQWLERYRRLWQARFDRMDDVVEKLKREDKEKKS